MPTIPLLDLGRRLHVFRHEIAAACERVVASGHVLLGDEVDAFEDEFAAFTGHRFAVAVGSGTDAIRLALQALRIGPGDEVIVPAFTAVPTVAAVCATGATPVPVDVDPVAAAIDPDAVRAAMTHRTQAIVPVHLYGRPTLLPDLGVAVVGDAAHAHGAVPPSSATATAYSFYPTKNLGGLGDGGAVVTDDGDVARRVRLLAHHAKGAGYVHNEIATNSRLSELEAAVLRIGLRHLEGMNARRRTIADSYRRATPTLRWHAPHPSHVHHLCVLRVEDRETFRQAVRFETAMHYPVPITRQPAYEGFLREPCPEADAWAAECVTVPCFPEMTDGEVQAVGSALTAWGRSERRSGPSR